MLVRPSKYIDVSGLCKIDYILNWEKKYEVRLVTPVPYHFLLRLKPPILIITAPFTFRALLRSHHCLHLYFHQLRRSVPPGVRPPIQHNSQTLLLIHLGTRSLRANSIHPPL
ncbi:hypothetical protein EI94DRAFT_1767266 [Lactarius quietus]|nr:hypothetical protein EI94DRAFT_1767266 [Lactarius quietus]